MMKGNGDKSGRGRIDYNSILHYSQKYHLHGSIVIVSNEQCFFSSFLTGMNVVVKAKISYI